MDPVPEDVLVELLMDLPADADVPADVPDRRQRVGEDLDLDPRPGRRVTAHAPLTLLHHQLRDSREHELSAPQQHNRPPRPSGRRSLPGLRHPGRGSPEVIPQHGT